MKQRLVGAIVVISLAVLFLPLLFDGKQEPINKSQYAIPVKPTMVIENPSMEPIEQQANSVLKSLEAVVADKNEIKVVGIGEGSDAQQSQVRDPGENGEPDKSDFVPVDEPNLEQVKAYVEQEQQQSERLQSREPSQPLTLADAWVIQVGAFSNEQNALALRDKLNQSGFKAYIQPAAKLHKVYVGPEIRKYRLEQQKSKLEQQFSLNTMILKYIP